MIVEERFEDREAGNKIETQIGQVGKGGLPPLAFTQLQHIEQNGVGQRG